MKITVEAENEEEEKSFGKKKEEWANVKHVAITGMMLGEGIVPMPLGWYSGNPGFIVGKMYEFLKHIERHLGRIEEKEAK